MTDLSNNTAKPSETNEVNSAPPKQTRMRQMKKAVRFQIFLAVGSLLVVAVLIFAMTSAWYTNVSKMSSLLFSVDVWGYSSDNISVSNEVFSIAPGASGIIPISIDNSGVNEKVKVNVSVSKSSMNSELKQRIFFFADTSKTVNNETVSRLYLGGTEDNSFSYVLLPGHELIMTSDYYNDVPLKWQWVYDRLGYYFRGTVIDGENSNVMVEEYIRPIEYDLDSAVFDADGELVSVAGTTLDQLLAAVSSCDGYEGSVSSDDAVTALDRKYYPIAVDSDNHGIWAYLCSESEINSGIIYDTELPSSQPNISATLNITAVNVPMVIENVSTTVDLRDALQNPDIDVIQLQDDLDLSTTFYVESDMKGTIDLNGYGINYDSAGTYYSMLQLEEGASLTVMNGALHGNGGNSSMSGSGSATSVAVECIGGDLTLSNVKIDNIGSAVHASDNLGTGVDSTIRIFNCDIDTRNTSIFVLGNNTASETPTQLIIQGSTVSSGYIAVSGNGNTGNRGTEYVIIDSTLTGYWTALYQPQHMASTVISGSTLSGYTGIAVKGGTVTVNDSNITGTGAYRAAAKAGSGWTDTGDGIYIEAVYDWSASVTVKGNSNIKSENAYAAQLFGAVGYGPGKLYIYGGSFDSGEDRVSVNSNNIGVAAIYGGTFEDGVSEYVVRYDND